MILILSKRKKNPKIFIKSITIFPIGSIIIKNKQDISVFKNIDVKYHLYDWNHCYKINRLEL
jgi:hypothetical protein